MLDYSLAANSNHWPISASSDDLDELRKVKQHDGAPSLEPRPAYKMEKKENKSLTNTKTGKVDSGAIYEATASGA
jgi:hypothetical protein